MRTRTFCSWGLQISFLLLFTTFIHAQTDYWVAKNNGITNLATLNLRDIAINSADDLFAATRGQGVFVSTDGGENWNQKINGLTDLTIQSVAVNHSDEAFVGTNSGMFKSVDKGESWTELETGLNISYATNITMCSNGYIFATTSFEGIIRSTDNGNSWIGVNNGISGGHAMSIYEDLAGQMLAGTSFGAIYFSNTYGEGWTQSSVGLPNTTTAPVLSLIESSDEVYFAGTGSGVYRSTDYGLNWSFVHAGGGNGYVYSFVFDHSNNLFIGTGSGGVYMSVDNGNEWQQINSGLTHLGVYSLAVNSINEVFAVTGEGIFKSDNTTGSIEEDNNEVKFDFVLEQNYPNPFNPSTIIRYYLPQNELVTLKLLNTLGQTIEILFYANQTKGSHEIEFHSEAYSSGVYFYQITAGNFVQTKKMILLQ